MPSTASWLISLQHTYQIANTLTSVDISHISVEYYVLFPWRSAVTFHTHVGLQWGKNKPLLSSWAFLSQTNVVFKMEKRKPINGRWAHDGLLGRVATGLGRGWWQRWWRWCTLNANVGLGNAQTGAHWNAELMCFLRVIYWGTGGWWMKWHESQSERSIWY